MSVSAPTQCSHSLRGECYVKSTVTPTGLWLVTKATHQKRAGNMRGKFAFLLFLHTLHLADVCITHLCALSPSLAIGQ